MLGHDEVEQAVHRGQLGEGIRADVLERGIGVHAAAVVLEHQHPLAGFGQREQQRLVTVGLGAQLALGLAALGDLEHHAADAGDRVVARMAHGPVGHEELPRQARLRRRDPGDLDLGERLSGLQHPPQVGADLARHPRQQVGHRRADVRLDGEAVHLGQAVVDAHVAQVVVEVGQADGRALEDHVEQAERLLEPRLQRRAARVRDGLAAMRAHAPHHQDPEADQRHRPDRVHPGAARAGEQVQHQQDHGERRTGDDPEGGG
jgi:hypothetical protein